MFLLTVLQVPGALFFLQQQVFTGLPASSLQMELQWAADTRTVARGGAESSVTPHRCSP